MSCEVCILVLGISSASNIIFSNGDLDPWSVGGVSTMRMCITIDGLNVHHVSTGVGVLCLVVSLPWQTLLAPVWV